MSNDWITMDGNSEVHPHISGLTFASVMDYSSTVTWAHQLLTARRGRSIISCHRSNMNLSNDHVLRRIEDEEAYVLYANYNQK